MSEQIHKRRKRYKGTHPRNFEEKYKEFYEEIDAKNIQIKISVRMQYIVIVSHRKQQAT